MLSPSLFSTFSFILSYCQAYIGCFVSSNDSIGSSLFVKKNFFGKLSLGMSLLRSAFQDWGYRLAVSFIREKFPRVRRGRVVLSSFYFGRIEVPTISINI